MSLSGQISFSCSNRASLWILMLAMGLNTVLDFLFVLSFGWGMAGTASATVVSQLFAAVVCLGHMKKQAPKLLFHVRDISFHFPLFQRTVMLGTISALHQSSLYIGKLLVQGAVNTGGTGMISAYTATARIEGFANSFGDWLLLPPEPDGQLWCCFSGCFTGALPAGRKFDNPPYRIRFIQPD